MSIVLPSLPFATNALAARGMCQETLELHHDKHHHTYVVNLNGLIDKQTALQGKSLEELVKLSYNNHDLMSVFNNAGQVWNHNVFWESLSPIGGGIPGSLEKKLREDFGSVDKFKEIFKASALGQFGSGWTWLVLGNDGKLTVTKTANANSPLATGDGKVLLALDVWEHAYYVDYRNRRQEFIENFMSKLANYEVAADKLQRA